MFVKLASRYVCTESILNFRDCHILYHLEDYCNIISLNPFFMHVWILLKY